MPGLTFSNEQITRDEGLHAEFTIWQLFPGFIRLSPLLGLLPAQLVLYNIVGFEFLDVALRFTLFRMFQLPSWGGGCLQVSVRAAFILMARRRL